MLVRLCLYLIILCSSNYYANKRITVIDKALNDKEGAFVLVPKQGMFFVDKLYEWDEKYYGKQVKVSGRLKLEYNKDHSTDSMKIQESVGTKATLMKPRWRLAQ